MKKLISVMSSEHGDKPYVFDTEDAVMDGASPEATVLAAAEAKALFERITHQGGAAFEVAPQRSDSPELQTKQRVRFFEQLGEHNILVPRYEGG